MVSTIAGTNYRGLRQVFSWAFWASHVYTNRCTEIAGTVISPTALPGSKEQIYICCSKRYDEFRGSRHFFRRDLPFGTSPMG